MEKLETQETVSLNCLAEELFPRRNFSGSCVHTLEVSVCNSDELPESDFTQVGRFAFKLTVQLS